MVITPNKRYFLFPYISQHICMRLTALIVPAISCLQYMAIKLTGILSSDPNISIYIEAGGITLQTVVALVMVCVVTEEDQQSALNNLNAGVRRRDIRGHQQRAEGGNEAQGQAQEQAEGGNEAEGQAEEEGEGEGENETQDQDQEEDQDQDQEEEEEEPPGEDQQ